MRSVAKMDHEAAMAAFSKFIDDEALNAEQIAFMRKVIDYVELNGYLELSDLQKPPFDKPQAFIRLFDREERDGIVAAIASLTENALRATA